MVVRANPNCPCKLERKAENRGSSGRPQSLMPLYVIPSIQERTEGNRCKTYCGERAKNYRQGSKGSRHKNWETDIRTLTRESRTIVRGKV